MEGPKEEKLVIPKFNDKSTESFHLWKLRMEAILETTNCLGTVDKTEVRPEVEDESNSQAAYDKKMKKAAAIIINGLGDKPLKAVQKYSKSPSDMWEKLCQRYASKTTSNKLSLITEAFGKTKAKNESMMDHIADLETIFAKLDNVGQPLNELIQVSILLSSIKDDKDYGAVVAAIRTMDEEKTSWETVTTRLVDEYKDKKNSKNSDDEEVIKAAIAKKHTKCDYCKKNGHTADECWNNPRSKNFKQKGKKFKPKNKPRLAVAIKRTVPKANETINIKAKMKSTSSHTDDWDADEEFPTEEDKKYKPPTYKEVLCTTPPKDNENNNNGKVNMVRLSICMEPTHTMEERDSEKFIIDTGATHHMCSNKSFFKSLRNVSEFTVTLGDSSTVTGNQVGEVDIILRTNRNSHSKHGMEGAWLRLTNVLYVESMGLNLISMNCLDDRNIHSKFGNGKCELYDGATMSKIGTGIRRDDGLYEIHTKVLQHQQNKLCYHKTEATHGIELWHKRLGHTNKDVIEEMARGTIVEGINLKKECDKISCNPCSEGKQTRSPLRGDVIPQDVKVEEVIFSDICGPITPTSWSKGKYFVTFLDAKSKHLSVKVLPSKEGRCVLDAYIQFKARFERQFNKKIKRLHTDNGGEYVNNEMQKHNKLHGIIHTTIAPHNPESNGAAERINRTLLGKVRSMISEAHLSGKFWAEALNHTAYLHNLTKNASNNKTPHELTTGNKPNLSHLKIFGCLVQVAIPKAHRKKLDKVSKSMIYMGHISRYMARAFDPTNRQIQYVRHGKYDEQTFPGYPSSGNWTERSTVHTNEGSPAQRAESTVSIETAEQISDSSSESGEELSYVSVYDTDEENNSQQLTTQQHKTQPLKLRLRLSPEAQNESTTEATEQNQNNDSAPQKRYNLRERRQVRFKLLSKSNMRDKDEPSLKEALLSDDKAEWIKSVHKEIEALKAMGTWELVPRPPGVRVLPCKIVLRLKRHADGTIDKYKARLVALGCLQRNADYNDTYSPVIDFTTIRLVLGIAALEGAEVHQMDVTGAFLYGKLQEDIYMEQPQGFQELGKESHVCKLVKSIYGLKQAPRVWYQHLKDCLARIGFEALNHSDCTFEKRSGSHRILILLYVDDMLLISKDKVLLNQTKKDLMRYFKVKDLGRLQSFLGVHITRSPKGFVLSQQYYTDKVLEYHSMNNCKPVTTPMDPSQYAELTRQVAPTDAEKAQMSQVPYREAIGQLIYLSTRTRPDIASAVNILSRFVAYPRPVHWVAVKRLLRYLKGTRQYSLLIQPHNTDLEGYADSDWAGGSDRVSVTGHILQFGGSTIYWKSSKQKCIALSSTEAEYVSLSELCREVTWIRNLLADLGYEQTGPTIVAQDNIGSIDWASDIGQFKRNKHIDIRLHHVRDLIKKKVVAVKSVPTEAMLADFMTKPLHGPKLNKDIQTIGMSVFGLSGGSEATVSNTKTERKSNGSSTDAEMKEFKFKSEKKLLLMCCNIPHKTHSCKHTSNQKKVQTTYTNSVGVDNKVHTSTPHTSTMSFQKPTWEISTSCAYHMCSKKELFKTFYRCADDFVLDNDRWVRVIGKGSIHIEAGDKILVIHSVLYTPYYTNLTLSVQQFLRSGTLAVFGRLSFKLVEYETRREIAEGQLISDRYTISGKVNPHAEVKEVLHIQPICYEWNHRSSGGVKPAKRKLSLSDSDSMKDSN